MDRMIKNVGEIVEDGKNKNLIRGIVEEIKFSKKNLWQFLLAGILAIFEALFIGVNEKTVSIFGEVVQDINNISIAFIAMIIGAYSIFQALLSKSVIIQLLKSKNNILRESNKSFLNLSIIYTLSIVVGTFIAIIMRVIPEEFLIMNNTELSNVVAVIGLLIYFAYYNIIFLEVIKFVINLFRMFCVYNAVSGMDAINEESDKMK